MNVRIIRLAGMAGLSLLHVGSASAHTFGAHGAGFAEGYMHPFIGMDHLLAMIAVGLWATQLVGRALWQVPLAFIAMMAGGAALAHLGLHMMFVEGMIAASVLILGLLVASSLRVSIAVSVMAVSFLALFHGYAHGLEMPQADEPVAYAAGFVLASASLHLLGIGLGLLMSRMQVLSRIGGTAIAATGVYLLASL